MIEIVILFFLLRRIGQMAEDRNEPTGKWRWAAFGAWILAEFIGIFIAMALFGATPDKPEYLMLAGLVFAPGGFLLVHRQLSQIPVPREKDQELNRIGEDEE